MQWFVGLAFKHPSTVPSHLPAARGKCEYAVPVGLSILFCIIRQAFPKKLLTQYNVFFFVKAKALVTMAVTAKIENTFFIVIKIN